MVVGTRSLVLWTVCCLVLVGTCRHRVLAQSADSLAAFAAQDPDSPWLEEAIEDAWMTEGVWRSRVRHPATMPPTYLGSAWGWQTRFNLKAGAISLGALLEKDSGEPFGPTREASWMGPERKRLALGIHQQRWTLLMGPFRLHTGFGLVSGRTEGWAPALSAPLRQPDILPRAGARVGTAAVPVPSGLSLLLHGPRGRLGLFHGHTWHAASTGRSIDEQLQISGPSSTSAFTTSSSIARRRQLGISLSGWTGALEGARWCLALFQALIRAESRMPADPKPVRLGFPAQRFWTSTAASLRLFGLDAATEWAFSPDLRHGKWSVRWRPRSGTGILVAHQAMHGTARSPFGEGARFRSEWDSESVWHITAQWRSKTTEVSGVSAWRSRNAAAVSADRRHRLSLAWQRAFPAFSMAAFVVRDAAEDVRWRTGVRVTLPAWHDWTPDLQLQNGLRSTQPGGFRRSNIMALGVRRAGSVWDVHVLALKRVGGKGTALLYASIPVMLSGFPVLGGTSDRWLGVTRIRRRLTRRWQLEMWARWDRSPDERSLQWQAQSTVSL